MLKAVVVAMAVSGSGLAHSQAEVRSTGDANRRTHEIGFGWSWHHFKSQDLIFSPRIFSGSSFRAGTLYYSMKTEHSRHEFSLALGKVNTRSSEATTYFVNELPKRTRPSTASLIDFRYGYARRILPGRKIKFTFGGSFESSFRYMDYRFGPSESDGSVVSYTLAAWFTSLLPLGPKQGLTFEATFPVLSWLARSKISVTDDQRLQSSSELWHVTKNGRLELPPNFIKLNASLTYARRLFDRAKLLVSYQFEFLSYDEPLEVNLMRNALETGLSYEF